jgi:hypothetical protein
MSEKIVGYVEFEVLTAMTMKRRRIYIRVQGVTFEKMVVFFTVDCV